MAFSFQIPKPKNLGQVLVQTSKTIRDGGGTFSGTEEYGGFTGNGVKGTYAVGDQISITITEKPFLVPESLVKSTITDFFKGV